MKVRVPLFSLAAATGLAIPALAIAQQPAPLPLSATAANPNQHLADSIASRLRGMASGANINIMAQEGIVHLTGTVRDAAQKDRIVTEVKAVAGVVIVSESLSLMA